MTGGEDILVAENLEVGFGAGGGWLGGERKTTKVLRGVSLRVGRGETVGIVGESGSGKTTLGRALLRLVDANAGSIHFDGHDITRLDERAMRPFRRRMQLIFQDPMASLNPRHTIRRIVTEPMRFHGVAADAEDAEARARAISGGQRQRVGIARAALLSPDFVLADEIVSGLDVSTQAQVLNLLKGLSRELGLSMAFISHDLSVIRAVCDRVYVLKQGRVVEEGPCERVFASPSDAYTRALLDAIPLPQIDPDWLSRESLEGDPSRY